MIRRFFRLFRRTIGHVWFGYGTVVFFGSLAYAQQGGGNQQGSDPLADVTTFLCSIYTTLTSTFGIAASLVVLAIGCLLWAIGARGALSRIGQGVIAITALVSLPTLFFTLFPSATNACQ